MKKTPAVNGNGNGNGNCSYEDWESFFSEEDVAEAKRILGDVPIGEPEVATMQPTGLNPEVLSPPTLTEQVRRFVNRRDDEGQGSDCFEPIIVRSRNNGA